MAVCLCKAKQRGRSADIVAFLAWRKLPVLFLWLLTRVKIILDYRAVSRTLAEKRQMILWQFSICIGFSGYRGRKIENIIIDALRWDVVGGVSVLFL